MMLFMHLVNTFILSRSPLQNSPDMHTLAQQDEVEYFIQVVIHHLPANETRLNTYHQGQADDAISKVMTYCRSRWPHKHQISDELRPYWAMWGELSYTTICYYPLAARQAMALVASLPQLPIVYNRSTNDYQLVNS